MHGNNRPCLHRSRGRRHVAGLGRRGAGGVRSWAPWRCRRSRRGLRGKPAGVTAAQMLDPVPDPTAGRTARRRAHTCASTRVLHRRPAGPAAGPRAARATAARAGTGARRLARVRPLPVRGRTARPGRSREVRPGAEGRAPPCRGRRADGCRAGCRPAARGACSGPAGTGGVQSGGGARAACRRVREVREEGVVHGASLAAAPSAQDRTFIRSAQRTREAVHTAARAGDPLAGGTPVEPGSA